MLLLSRMEKWTSAKLLIQWNRRKIIMNDRTSSQIYLLSSHLISSISPSLSFHFFLCLLCIEFEHIQQQNKKKNWSSVLTRIHGKLGSIFIYDPTAAAMEAIKFVCSSTFGRVILTEAPLLTQTETTAVAAHKSIIGHIRSWRKLPRSSSSLPTNIATLCSEMKRCNEITSEFSLKNSSPSSIYPSLALLSRSITLIVSSFHLPDRATKERTSPLIFMSSESNEFEFKLL